MQKVTKILQVVSEKNSRQVFYLFYSNLKKKIMLEEKQIVQNYSLICEISIIILICNKKPNCLRVMTAIKNATKLRQNKSFFF